MELLIIANIATLVEIAYLHCKFSLEQVVLQICFQAKAAYHAKESSVWTI